MNKKIFILTLIGIILMTIPLTVLLTLRKQETRSRANASTSLSFTPVSTISAPIQKNIGDTFSVDIMVDPGTSLVSFVKFQIKYDPTKIALENTNAFVLNTIAFPIMIEGPITTSNTLAASVSIGSDPTKVIQTTTRLGTLNFKAVGATADTPTQITYTSITQTLSAGSNEQAGENTLSTTIPANIEILAVPTPTPQPTSSPTPTPTRLPTATPTPASTPTPIPTATPTPQPTSSPTPIPTPATTLLSLTIYQHGIWNSGDNTNPTDTSLSNKNPVHPTVIANLQLFDTNSQLVGQENGSLMYANTAGNYQGIIGISPNTIPSGNYYLKVKTPGHLQKRVPGFLTITSGQTNTVPAATLVTGDANNDNRLDILDYNLLLGCYSDLAPAISCDANKKTATDFNDDSFVNQVDYNLFLREIATQPGQ